MSATALMDRLRDGGFTISAVDGRLLVAPFSRLPAELRQELRDAKPELLLLLAANDSDVDGNQGRQDRLERHARQAGGVGDVRLAPPTGDEARPSTDELLRRPLPDPDPLPPGGRELMGWIAELGAMDSGNLALALGWPVGSTIGMALRLAKMGLLRSRGGAWALTRAAEKFALFPQEPRR